MKLFFLEDELSQKEMSYEFSKFHILPVPLEKTVSYGKGTSQAPESIIHASRQLERSYGCPCDFGIYTHNEFDCSLSFNEIFQNLEKVIYKISTQNKIPIILGGEHSVTYGAIKGFKKKFLKSKENFGIIQLDAHADLRREFNGNKDSHATIMYKIASEKIKIFQIGVRALSREEIKIRNNFNIKFKSVEDCRKVLDLQLPFDFPKNIYITFDTDCLDPSIMPATGTPVPNGFYYAEVLEILKKLTKGRDIIGFDYVEFSPIKNFHAYDFISANIVYDIMKLCIKS